MSLRKPTTILSTLTINNVQKRTAYVDKLAQRRVKMLENLKEQRNSAAALIEGTDYTATKAVWEKDENGVDVKVQKPKRLRNWFYNNGEGEWYLQLRFANKTLELQPGKFSIVVASKEKLVETIDKLIEAVTAKELDPLMAKIS